MEFCWAAAKRRQIESNVYGNRRNGYGGSGIPLEKNGRYDFCLQNREAFGTEWDDQTIRPENFKESIIKKEETGTVCEIIKEKAEEKAGE